jgi:pilus assembly protein Flp/PilA
MIKKLKKLHEEFKSFFHSEEGLTIVEYAVAAGMITLIVVNAFKFLGQAVNTIIRTITGYL